MILSISNQAYIFLITVVIGFIIGLIYDFFRLTRKIFNHQNFAVYIEDVIFWLISTFITFYILLHKNNLEFRLYLLLGIAIGLIFYFSILSYYILYIFVKAIDFFAKPVRFLMKIFTPYTKKANVMKNKAVYRKKIVLQKFMRYGSIKLKQIKLSFKIARKKI